MNVQNSNLGSYLAQEKMPEAKQAQQLANRPSPSKLADNNLSLGNFSEKAVLVFENLTSSFSPQDKADALTSLTSIGKAASFAAMNGYKTQEERIVVSEYFSNYSNVLSDEAIKKMIYAKLDDVSVKNKDFLKKFADSLSEPLKAINIKV